MVEVHQVAWVVAMYLALPLAGSVCYINVYSLCVQQDMIERDLQQSPFTCPLNLHKVVCTFQKEEEVATK